MLESVRSTTTWKSIKIAAMTVVLSACFAEAGSSDGSGSSTMDTATSTTGASGGATSVGPSTTGMPPTEDSSTSDVTGTSGADCVGAVCVPAAPTGWQGPIVVSEVEPGMPRPPCPPEFPSRALDGRAGLSVTPAACGCECGPTAGATCDGDALVVSDFDCDRISSTDSQSVGQSCEGTTITFDTALRASGPDPDLTGASCEPTPSAVVPPPMWVSDVRICSGVIGDACDGGHCVPELGDEFARQCIFSAGDRDCPQGPYVNRLLTFQDVEDTRGCGPCSCGVPDVTCGGTITLSEYNPVCAGSEVVVDTLEVGTCDPAIDINGVNSMRYTPAIIDEGCAPMPGAPTGAIVGTDPVTVCCLP